MDELEGALPVSDRRRSQTATGPQRRPSAIRTAAVPNGPPSTYQCNEQGYLKKLASDNIAVHDPLAVVKAGYAVCAITGPADLHLQLARPAPNRRTREPRQARAATTLSSTSRWLRSRWPGATSWQSATWTNS
jgi:hypothetical protein